MWAGLNILQSSYKYEFNPISADMEYTPREGDVNFSVQAKSLKMTFVFLKEEKICYKSILRFVFRFSQSSKIAFESQNSSTRKTDFSERGLALEGLNSYFNRRNLSETNFSVLASFCHFREITRQIDKSSKFIRAKFFKNAIRENKSSLVFWIF